MILLAFTLGLFGSLHCIGMCGPIAFGLHQSVDSFSIFKKLQKTLIYNSGRVVAYLLLGMILGIIGQGMWMAGLQKIISVSAGILLIFLFCLTLDLEQVVWKIPFLQKNLQTYRRWILSKFTHIRQLGSFKLGFLNGLIPCGLVYLALAGAILQDTLIQSTGFMLFFGMGTFPAMFAIAYAGITTKNQSSKRWQKFLPYLQLVVGIWFVYRGLFIEMPPNLDFFSSLSSGPSCH